MKKCTILHTGIGEVAKGVIKDNLVYLQGEDNKLYFPEEMFLAKEECEESLIQFEVDGKWGFANIYTGEIFIEPMWDYAGPFYRGNAHVAIGAKIVHAAPGLGGYMIEGGKHGYIDLKGNIVIPLEYDNCDDIPYKQYYMVQKNEKWGLINKKNKTIIPLLWRSLDLSPIREGLIFCCIEEPCELHVGAIDRLMALFSDEEPTPTCTSTLKWGVYDKNFNLFIQPELDEKPFMPQIRSNSRNSNYNSKYYILRKKRKYGILRNDGKLITNIELSKKMVTGIIKAIC